MRWRIFKSTSLMLINSRHLLFSIIRLACMLTCIIHLLCASLAEQQNLNWTINLNWCLSIWHVLLLHDLQLDLKMFPSATWKSDLLYKGIHMINVTHLLKNAESFYFILVITFLYFKLFILIKLSSRFQAKTKKSIYLEDTIQNYWGNFDI